MLGLTFCPHPLPSQREVGRREGSVGGPGEESRAILSPNQAMSQQWLLQPPHGSASEAADRHLGPPALSEFIPHVMLQAGPASSAAAEGSEDGIQKFRG